MERIQSALAKARAAREDTPPSRRPASQSAPAPQAGEEAWAALQGFEPDPRHLCRKRVTTLKSGPEAIEFDRLRTRMLQRMQANGWKSVAVVSPSRQNGKSTVTANLALSFARQGFLTTMVIELDLHRPSLSEILGIRSAGLDIVKVLTGEAPFTAHAVRVGTNLVVAPARPHSSGTAELLQSPKATAVLEEIAAVYAPAITLYDTPPLDASDDTIGLLGNVDCALIVAAAGVTTVAEIDLCEREVSERTQVLGVVLNKCRHESHTPDYGYY